MSKSAGKKGTRKGRPRGSRGNGSGGRMLGHVISFFTGTLTAQGAGAAIQETGVQALAHPAADGVASAGGGAVVSAASAVNRQLRPFVFSQLAGNAVGGLARGLVRYFKAKGTGRSVAEVLRQKRLAGAGNNTRETLRENRMSAMQRRFTPAMN